MADESVTINEIFYDNIAMVSYNKPIFTLNMSFVEIALKTPNKISNTLYFAGWGDNNELIAWVLRLQTNIKEIKQ